MSDTTNKTVQYASVFGAYERDGVTFLDHRATARVAAACEAVRVLSAVLVQRELDADTAVHAPLTLDGRVAAGMLTAIGCCAELVEAYALGVGPADIGATTYPSDSSGADLMRETARKAASMRRNADSRAES